MRRRLLSLIVAGPLMVSSACGDETGIGEAASAALSPHVRAVESKAAAGDRQGALGALAALRQQVGQLRAEDEVSSREAATVLEAALEVERQLMSLPQPPPQEASDDTRPERTVPGGDEMEEWEEEVRKRAEDAAKKAEEDARKRAEDAKKRAEDRRDD